MTRPEANRSCRGLTEGWCARLGLAKAFEANQLHDGSQPLHEFWIKRNEAAELIGRGGCAELSLLVTEPCIAIDPAGPDPPAV